MKINELDALRRVDPAAGIPDGPLTEQELAVLDRIRTRIAAEQHVAPINGSTHQKPVRRRVVLLGAAAASVAIGAAGVVIDPFGSTGVAMAVTPPLLDHELAAGRPANAELIALAAKAARDTTLPGSSGGVHTVRAQSWNLSTNVDGEKVTSAVVPEQSELTWSSVDLSGQLVRKDSKTGKVVDNLTWAKGTYEQGFSYPLSGDPTSLRAQLQAGHDIDANGTVALTEAVGDVYNETMPVPAVRSALLTLLSGRKDVVALGPMVDRAGRTGAAFAVETDASGLPTRYVLIFDPATGRLLADEEVLTKTAGKLNVRVPSVIGYTLYQ
ncbi:CU044_5270 family protein [Kribbella sp. NBC_01505]|uniref:CU044_5270 family protein n=1 Tax=Kribbella sp. NBC_01505 TaxID=2903580 RepID=UPI003864F6F5